MNPDDILTTPFRAHLEHCRELGIPAQLSECADYIQNIDILVSEFLESYYMVERLWDPESPDASEAGSDEMILEPFYESFEFSLVDPETKRAGESIVCVSGALGPLPSDQHPALSRRGLDFVGLRADQSQHIVLGTTQSSKTESVFVLLLRALNGLAELSPPLRMAKLGSDVLQKGGIPENAVFSLCLGISERDDDPDANALLELTRRVICDDTIGLCVIFIFWCIVFFLLLVCFGGGSWWAFQAGILRIFFRISCTWLIRFQSGDCKLRPSYGALSFGNQAYSFKCS